MTLYFNSIERLAHLEREASKWVGTPFADFSAVPGRQGGVSCGYLAVAILSGCDHFPASKEIPRVAWKHNHGTATSSIEAAFDEWMGDGLFGEVEPGEPVRPGDVLGIQVKSCVDHVAMVLGGGQAISIRLRGRVQVGRYANAKILRIWRPLEHGSK